MFNKMKFYSSFAFILLLLVVLSGCGGGAEIGSDTPFQLELPPEVELELVMLPDVPVAGEPTKIMIKLLDDHKPKDGMRIELRENSRANRIYDAQETQMDGRLTYEVDAIFEQSGENYITYHFNVDQHHIMSSIAVEVK